VRDSRSTVYAEALWDHVTLDPVELGFRSGDVIEVKDMLDKDWWWGRLEDKEGWFLSAFVAVSMQRSAPSARFHISSFFIPLPRRLCFHLCLYVCLSVCCVLTGLLKNQ